MKIIRANIFWIVTAILLTSSSSFANTVCVENVPQYGDLTCTTTTITTNNVTSTTTTTHTTDNLLTQDFTDGNWQGTNQDTRHGNSTIAGIGGQYVETTINHSDTDLTDQNVNSGFSSNLGADIWFWNQDNGNQSVKMTQKYTNGTDIISQSRTVSGDCENYNGCTFQTYNDTMSVSEGNNAGGNVNVKFDFFHSNTSSHKAADLKNPTLNITYTNIEEIVNQVNQEVVTSQITYCFDRTPNTCPVTEELVIIDTVLEDFEDDIVEIVEIIDTPDPVEFSVVDIEPVYNNEAIITDNEVSSLDDFFFEEGYLEIDYYEDVELAYDIPETIILEEIELIDELPTVEEKKEIGLFSEAYVDESFDEEITTEDIIEEFIQTTKTEEAPIEEPTEIVMAEEPTEKEVEQIEEQPNSESIITDESKETTNVAEQEEIVEESTEIATTEGDSTEEPDIVEEAVEEEIIEVAQEEAVEEEIKEEEIIIKEDTIEIKKARLEEIINEKDLDTVSKIAITLEAVNLLVSQEIIKAAVNISAFQNNNVQELFTYSAMPQGVSMVETALPAIYYQNLYSGQDLLNTMLKDDPLAQYEIVVNQAVNNTNQKLAIYRSLINAKSNN